MKKEKPKGKSKYMRTCERCGNEVFSVSRKFRCNWCGQVNNLTPDGSSQHGRKENCYG